MSRAEWNRVKAKVCMREIQKSDVFIMRSFNTDLLWGLKFVFKKAVLSCVEWRK